MRYRWVSILFLCWVSLMVFACGPSEKQIESFMIQLRDKDVNVRIKGAHALGKIGEPAIPELIKALRDENPYVRCAAAYALERVGEPAKIAVPQLIAVAMEDEDRHVRYYAAMALGWIGEPEALIAPVLIKALGDENEIVGSQISSRLGRRIGEPAVPALRKALQSENRNSRVYAAYVLSEIGKPAQAAIPELIEALNDSDGSVRYAATEALKNIGEPGSVAVPALIEALNDEQENVRQNAAEAIGRMGKPTQAAAPALVKLLRRDRNINSNAHKALIQIGEPAVPALTEALGDADMLAREAVAYTLVQIGKPLPIDVPELIQLLRDENWAVRKLTIFALIHVGEPAVPELINVLSHERETNSVRKAAYETLQKIGTHSAHKGLSKYKEWYHQQWRW